MYQYLRTSTKFGNSDLHFDQVLPLFKLEIQVLLITYKYLCIGAAYT